jgi:hypothetical protein
MGMTQRMGRAWAWDAAGRPVAPDDPAAVKAEFEVLDERGRVVEHVLGALDPAPLDVAGPVPAPEQEVPDG